MRNIKKSLKIATG